MSALFAVVPWYYRWLMLAALVAAVWGHGWVKGAAHVQRQLDAERAAVTAVGNVQAAKHVAVTKQGAAITASVGGEYAKAISSVSDLYGHGRVRSHSSSSSAATVPEAPGRADEKPADAGLGVTISPPGETQCKDLTADAAATTVQLLYLQDWLLQQQEAWSQLAQP